MLALAGVGLLWGGIALAGPTDAEKCQADKIKRAGWYNFCRMKAESKGVKKSEAPDFTKCDDKIVAKFDKAETKWGPECPTSGDVEDIKDVVTDDVACLMALLAGTTAAECDTCGDGVVDAGEQCDGLDLGGETCASLIANTSGTLACTVACQFDVSGCVGNPPTSLCGNGVIDMGEDCDFGDLGGRSCRSEGFFGGTLACGTGCALDTSGCHATRFSDNGDGTVSDNYTGLMWEKKVAGSGCSHCVDDLYDWYTAMNDWISEANGWSGDGSTQSGLGGHTDWRMPTSAELQTILDCSFGLPCIDPVFGPTQSYYYWSSTTYSGIPDNAWDVGFYNGYVLYDYKLDNGFVRAVRGGL
jgi:hypothetical protein